MTTRVSAPPATPICRAAEDVKVACPFATICHETRQRLSHYATPPIRGQACWAFQMLSARLGSEAQAERAAIQAEGTNA